MDIWRIRPSGEGRERLTDQKAAVNSLAPLDARTLIYTAPSGGRNRTVTLDPRCANQNDAQDQFRSRALHLCLGESRRQALRGDARQPECQPLARPPR